MLRALGRHELAAVGTADRIQLILRDHGLDLGQVDVLLAKRQADRRELGRTCMLAVGARRRKDGNNRINLGFGEQFALLVGMTGLSALGFGLAAGGLGGARRCGGWVGRGWLGRVLRGLVQAGFQ